LNNPYQDLYPKSLRITVVVLLCSYLSNIKLARILKKH
jgi:hypothetical protein